MKRKIGKIIVIFILIFSMIYVPMPKAYASLADNARAEGDANVIVPPEPDDPNPPPIENPPPVTDEIKRTTKTYYTSISGNVYEQLGLKDESGESNTKPVERVLACLFDQSENQVAATWTDKDGNYSFTPDGTGTYTTKFAYGMIRKC